MGTFVLFSLRVFRSIGNGVIGRIRIGILRYGNARTASKSFVSVRRVVRDKMIG